MKQRKIWKWIHLNWRIVVIVISIVIMVFSLSMMVNTKTERVQNGKVYISENDLNQNTAVTLDGEWEFYFNQLLLPQDFISDKQPKIDSFMRVPGSWDNKGENQDYPNKGVATYRLIIQYPATIKDPALRIENIASAYRLYVNGQFVDEVGKVSDQKSGFLEGAKLLLVDLPKDKQEIEVVFQVANLNYAKGGLRESPIFGSMQVLEKQHDVFLALQFLFIGGVLIFGIYYLLVFVLQTKNWTALIFSVVCFITAIRSFIWGELPVMIFFPTISYKVLAFINYVTGYLLIPMVILFLVSIYPMESKKMELGMVLFPSIVFEVLLAITSPQFMSSFTNYLYLVILVQMIYILIVMIRAVIRKRENAILLYITICAYILTINLDILHFKGTDGINGNNMFLYGNLVVLIAMSYVQAKHQANIRKKLLLYNENLLEADQLKDQIMATEMSFLQAQIKPHFLYNSLDAIANVCEKDGQKAAKLIIDLAIYLRGSLEFNQMNKMATIEKELEFVDTYFRIEQARFGGKITLIEEVDSVQMIKIPVLVLQPLVENAVRHGITKKLRGGTVFIHIEHTKDGTCIEIRDDGIGMEKEKLESLLSDERIDKGVGLLNIHHRLCRLYGKGLEITSEVGIGTCVKFVIPEQMIMKEIEKTGF